VWLVHSAQVDRPDLSKWAGWIADFLQKSGTFEYIRTIRRAIQETCGRQLKSLSEAAIKVKGATVEIQSPGTPPTRKSIRTASQEALAGPKLHSLGVESSKGGHHNQGGSDSPSHSVALGETAYGLGEDVRLSVYRIDAPWHFVVRYLAQDVAWPGTKSTAVYMLSKTNHPASSRSGMTAPAAKGSHQRVVCSDTPDDGAWSGPGQPCHPANPREGGITSYLEQPATPVPGFDCQSYI
jgi:hypothetical protein